MKFANDLFLRAFTDERLPHPPVWLLRQAGRYLPEYRATRAKAGGFMDLCRSPSFCAEVLLQPLARYQLDAAIVFSDILTIPDAMGLGLSFGVGEGPRLARPLQSESAIDALRVPDVSTLQYVFDAVAECRRALTRDGVQSVPLIGFSGSPFTLACYMVEGAGSQNDFATTRRMMLQRPDLLERVLAANEQIVTDYLEQQARAGANVLMLFDSWGGVLAPLQYERFSLSSLRRIIAALKLRVPDVPIIVFSKGAGHSVAAIAAAGADAVHIDWQSDLSRARADAGESVTLQGNFDPLLLTTDAATIQRAVSETLASFDGKRRYIANLGHGITPDAQPELVAALVNAIRS
ncbi:MAG: uroporphyrinogen decarboxylase [Betaproteobacteria bacterium]|nr:MAG: uroporphyrinogen decarboxylase [Betaproteobacteria bacterium]